jgi:hypothetical protein
MKAKGNEQWCKAEKKEKVILAGYRTGSLDP